MTAVSDIAILDSGVGGLSVWQEVRRLLPAESILYLADQAHLPYGRRPLAEVRSLAMGCCRFFLREGAKLIVLACNTASAAALRELREIFPYIRFVGMEPAVKPAAESTRTGKVVVLATEATFQGRLFASVVERFAEGVEVRRQVCPGLVEKIEAGEADSAEAENMLRAWLEPHLRAGADCVVLGCTHYPLARPALERVVAGRARLIDPAAAVARQIRRVLEQEGKSAPGSAVPRLRFVSTAAAGAAAFERQIRRWVDEPCEVLAARWREDEIDLM
ncbi:MAG: glutamate racemase [Planctomycetota bacterium]|nr:glutamate racemase [Planctomycetota bacterium]